MSPITGLLPGRPAESLRPRLRRDRHDPAGRTSQIHRNPRTTTRLGEPVKQRQQVALLVLVSRPEQDLQGESARFDYEVEAATGRAAERARDLLAPLFASTSEASTITRDQSSLSAPASCFCSTRI